MIAIRTILAGVELHRRRSQVPEGSRNAVAQAAWLAREVDAELVILHSTWRDGDDDLVSARPDPETRLTAENRATLEELLAETEQGGTRARLALTPRRPWMAMTFAALRREADLIVVGKRDEPTSEGRRLGSVAAKLLRKCPAPVWVVKPEHDLGHRLVLAATDLTVVGDRAVVWGAFVADRHGSELHVVHAYQVPMSLQLAASRMAEEEYAAEVDAIRSKAQAHVDEVISASDFDGESAVHLGKSSPALAIREAVEHLHPDLLVMGTVSRGGIAGFLVGNTAERLLDRVDCSILAVKPDDFVCPVELPAQED